MMKNIQFVYFDIGGVLIVDFSKNNKWNDLLLDLRVPDIQKDIFTQKFKRYVDDLCTGVKESNEVLDILKKELQLDVSDEYDLLTGFVDRFEASPSVCPLVEVISKKYKTGLLTNMYPQMLDKINEKGFLPVVEWDVVIDSSIVGLSKPYEEIFVYAEKMAGIEAENILFVDNLIENLEAAEKRGWQTLLYDPANVEKSNKDLELILIK